MRNRVARAAALLSLALTTVLILRIIAIGKPGVFVVLAPALSGALLAIWRQGRAILIASALLTGATASVLLIGGSGSSMRLQS
jgi:trimethylamine:corrinoid methyltransferase-like protein